MFAQGGGSERGGGGAWGKRGCGGRGGTGAGVVGGEGGRGAIWREPPRQKHGVRDERADEKERGELHRAEAGAEADAQRDGFLKRKWR